MGAIIPRLNKKLKGRVQMAQFFNFKGDYFGLTESDVQKNIDLYGYNI